MQQLQLGAISLTCEPLLRDLLGYMSGIDHQVSQGGVHWTWCYQVVYLGVVNVENLMLSWRRRSWRSNWKWWRWWWCWKPSSGIVNLITLFWTFCFYYCQRCRCLLNYGFFNFWYNFHWVFLEIIHHFQLLLAIPINLQIIQFTLFIQKTECFHINSLNNDTTLIGGYSISFHWILAKCVWHFIGLLCFATHLWVGKFRLKILLRIHIIWPRFFITGTIWDRNLSSYRRCLNYGLDLKIIVHIFLFWLKWIWL